MSYKNVGKNMVNLAVPEHGLFGFYSCFSDKKRLLTLQTTDSFSVVRTSEFGTSGTLHGVHSLLQMDHIAESPGGWIACKTDGSTELLLSSPVKLFVFFGGPNVRGSESLIAISFLIWPVHMLFRKSFSYSIWWPRKNVLHSADLRINGVISAKFLHLSNVKQSNSPD